MVGDGKGIEGLSAARVDLEEARGPGAARFAFRSQGPWLFCFHPIRGKRGSNWAVSLSSFNRGKCDGREFVLFTAL